MSYIYSNPKRESDPHAQPKAEVFYVPNAVTSGECLLCLTDPYSKRAAVQHSDGNHSAGWYIPSAEPDGEPNGPFATKAEAIADAQS